MAKRLGAQKGKGGSMHFFAPWIKILGRAWNNVGGQTPLGLGMAFALKHQGLKGACLCYMGDGATNQGPFLRITQPSVSLELARSLHYRK